MKIRLDFVTNSSSSSFVAYGIYDKELADKVKEYVKFGFEHHCYTTGAIRVYGNVVSVTRELGDIDARRYNISEMFDECDKRTANQIKSDEEKAITIDNIIKAFGGFFERDFVPDGEMVDLITKAIKENGVKSKVYFDSTESYSGENFSLYESELEENRKQARYLAEHRLSKEDKNLAKEWKFSIDDEGGQCVLLKYCGKKNEIDIPVSINGLVVVGIEDGCFAADQNKNCRTITSVKMHSGIKSIGSYAFYECALLSNVEMACYMETIKSQAFGGCKNLTKICIPDTITRIERNAFYGCEQMEFVEYNGGMYFGNPQNPYQALIGISDNQIMDFSINPQTSVIADSAFENCRCVQSITIPQDNIHFADLGVSKYMTPVIKGKKGSFVEKYAKKKRLKFESIL